MEITEVKINLKEGVNDKLKAFATVTLDDEFVIRDIKIINGKKGLFVAMPSAKATLNCPHCGKKNPVRDKFCGECGKHLPARNTSQDPEARREEYRDIAHPIKPECRDYIQNKIVAAYHEKMHSMTAYGSASSV